MLNYFKYSSVILRAPGRYRSSILVTSNLLDCYLTTTTAIRSFNVPLMCITSNISRRLSPVYSNLGHCQTMSTINSTSSIQDEEHNGRTDDAQHRGVVERAIHEKLMKAFSPITHLAILNESHRHNVPVNSETHFKVVIVASMFDAIPRLVDRHRMVNTVLADELQGPVHALSIVAKTPNQWSQQNNTTTIEPSPACRGGDGSLPQKFT